jgi:molybdate transport system substrate-binding protein
MTHGRALAVLLTASVVAGSGFAAAGESRLVVSTAVSLKEPLAAAIEDFMDSPGQSGSTIDIQLGGSSILAQQILRGAPAGVFLSASLDEINRLVDAKLVVRTCPLGGNELVVVVPVDADKLENLDQLLDSRFERVGVANPRTSPLGRYTEQALEAAHLASKLEAKRIPAEHARQVIDYVSRGEVDAAIVYATDAARFSDHVSIALQIDQGLHQPILYHAALIDRQSSPSRARRLFDFLCSDAGRVRFVESGLTPWPGRR